MKQRRTMLRRLSLCMSMIVVFGITSFAHANVIDFLVNNNITDGTDATVKITLDDEFTPGRIQVTVESIEPLVDIRGIFFHVTDESLLSGMTVAGNDATDSQFVANSVINLGQGANLNGNPSINQGPFDGGVEIGQPGIGQGDDIGSTTFILSHANEPLDVGLFTNQWFGVRLTSVGPIGNRDGSSKLQGMVPEPTSGIVLLTLAATVAGRRPRR